MTKTIIITEAALDAALVSGTFSKTSGLPVAEGGLHLVSIDDQISGFRIRYERDPVFFASIDMEMVEYLISEGGLPVDVFRRVARVIKGLKSPPVHLPRQWLEYHHRNLLSFFALPRDVANLRWIVELSGSEKFADFVQLTSADDEVDLSSFLPSANDVKLSKYIKVLLEAAVPETEQDGSDVLVSDGLAQEIDLQAIGSSTVVAGRTYEDWRRHLTSQQLGILNSSIDTSIRIVGPAGSGKTLSLCMRALQISRDIGVISQGKRILVATHSWAMSERIDGILSALNSGIPPGGVTVFPLLSLLELHAGHIGQRKTEIIGDDSTDGRVRSLEIIGEVVSRVEAGKFRNISQHLFEGLQSAEDTAHRADLIIDLYEEISGVLAASGVAPDDPNAIQEYIAAKREDWMPPFITVFDRIFSVAIYREFIQRLVDRAAITTDQFVLDAIRVLETFTWRIKKETEGYDYIIVDELQLFDPQERSALELLGRSRKGVPYVTAEDPSQGVFAALNARRISVDNAPVYLDIVHRFNREIFEFINFLYQRFPLNAVPLKIAGEREEGESRPSLVICKNREEALSEMKTLVLHNVQNSAAHQRTCVVTLGDVDAELVPKLESCGLSVTRLESFDDVEQLSYRRRSIVVSPWQFIGGTQFAHVIVLALGVSEQTSQFGRLREMVAVYLSCSRAADTLKIVCAGYIPSVVSDAADQGFMQIRSLL